MKKIFLFFLILVFPVNLLAEMVVLKSGEKISGPIIEKNDEYIKIDFRGTPITYYTFEIESIDDKSPDKQKSVSSKDGQEVIKISAVSAKEYLERGNIYYTKGELVVALLNFNKAIEINPNYAEAYAQRGLVFAAANKPDQAILEYNKALELNPEYAEAYYIRGLSYANKRDFNQALADYTIAIKKDPDYADAYLNRAFIYINQGKPEEAEPDLDKALQISPKAAAVYFLRGFIDTNRGNFDQAIANYTKAIEMNPGYAEAYLYRGIVYAYQASIDKSKEDPKSPRAYINIGPTYAEKISLNQAISDVTKAIQINPDFAEAYANRARMYLFKREYDLAWNDVHKLESLGANLAPDILEELKKASRREK